MIERSQPIEELVKILASEGCEPERASIGCETFERIVRFSSCGTPCWIEWWANGAYLLVGSRYGSQIRFSRIRPRHSWPYYRRALEFFDDGSPESIVILPTKLLDWQKEELEEAEHESA